jgi:segregation and condensation protein B
MPPEHTQPTVPLSVRIEAVLFWKGEPITIEELSALLGAHLPDIESALGELDALFKSRGIAIVRSHNTVMLGTSPDTASLIETLRKEELSRDLGKAGLETLSIILYKGPLSRKEIDYIRGVNSTFIIRNLMIRGLVVRIEEGKDGRSFRYQPSIELLSYLGVQRVEDLPEFETVAKELASFEKGEQTVTQDASIPSVAPTEQPENVHTTTSN